MAIVMIFEITLDYQIILPLMLTCVVADYTSVSIEKQSIYAEALKRKGAGDYRRQLAELHVRDLMKPKPLTISPKAKFSEIAEKFLYKPDSIISTWQITVGLLALCRYMTVKNYLNTPELAKVVIAGDILHDSIPVVRPTASLTVALERFRQHDG